MFKSLDALGDQPLDIGAGRGRSELAARYLNARRLKFLWYRFDVRDATLPHSSIICARQSAGCGRSAGRGGHNYSVSLVGAPGTITQLAQVAWVGGSTGNWSNGANWAGGAIPDHANVAAVTIPAGTTVTYDSGVAGTTKLASLTDQGSLVMAAGALDTTGTLSTQGFEQTGGTLEAGTLSIHASSGSGIVLGNAGGGRRGHHHGQSQCDRQRHGRGRHSVSRARRRAVRMPANV